MSRCFPFPPPGYEKKARTDDVDLLKKEKDSEKKHKKDKKNRDKKEGKDKGKKEKDRSDGKHRDKDRSDGKHRDKKEKKEKNRDKKDRDKDEARRIPSDETHLPGQSIASGEMRLPGQSIASGEKKLPGQFIASGEKRLPVQSIASGEKRLPGQSAFDNGDKASEEKKLSGKSEIRSGELFIQKGKERTPERSSIPGDKKSATQILAYNERTSQNSRLTVQTKESKFVQDFDNRIRDEAKGTGKPLVEKFTDSDARKDEGMFRVVAKAMDGKERKRGNRRLDGQGIRDGPKFGGNTMVQNLPAMVQLFDKTQRSLENDIEKRIEGKEKIRQKEGDDRHGDKLKDKEGQGKEKKRKKEKKKEKKVKEKSGAKNMERNKLEGNKDSLAGVQNAKTCHLPKDSPRSVVTEGNLKKRKDLDTNGFFSANDIRPSKVPRPTPSHSSTENGRILATSDTSSGPFTSARPGPVNNLKADAKEHKGPANNLKADPKEHKGPVNNLKADDKEHKGPVNNLKADAKEHKINGIIEPQVLTAPTTQPPSIPTTKSSHTTTQTDKKPEVPRRPPHPDLKYLSEVLTVPKLEEWSDFDDQEWLFQVSDSQSKKPRLGSLRVDETPGVWSEALQIESVDVCALPYVVPY